MSTAFSRLGVALVVSAALHVLVAIEVRIVLPRGGERAQTRPIHRRPRFGNSEGTTTDRIVES